MRRATSYCHSRAGASVWKLATDEGSMRFLQKLENPWPKLWFENCALQN
jgi:hypothetical protein